MNGYESKYSNVSQTVRRFSPRSILAILVIVYLLMMSHAYFFADRMIFQPAPSSYRDEGSILKIPVGGSNSSISAIYLPNPDAKYTILYSHGNAEDLGDIRDTLTRYRERGFSVIAYDYRGYGTSAGIPSEKAACEDIGAVYAHLVGPLRINPKLVIVYGRSIGGGPSLDLAARQPVAALILESTFTSIFRVPARIPLFPFDKFENIRKIEEIGCPVLVIHGKRDEIIPFWHGEKLYEQAREPKMQLWVDRADHNNLLEVANEEYWLVLERFLRLIKD